MCSIGGFISQRPLDRYKAKRLASALLHFGLSRGDQSSGIYFGGTLLKRAVSASDLIYADDFNALFTDESSTICLTHTRLPTSGERGDQQAHPFWVGNTISVHNGSIHNCKSIREKWRLDKPSGVDSELFTEAIDKYGIRRLPEIASDFSASAALGIYHDDVLYLARDGNPIEYTTIIDDDNHITIFGSTQSQVLCSIAHVWLVPGLTYTETLRSQEIFSVAADGKLTSVGAFRTMAYVVSSSTTSTSTNSRRDALIGSFWDRYDDYGIDQSIWRKQQQQRQPESKKPIKNGGDSKAKKDRNRNSPSARNQKTR